jgi:hypothetical protein
VSNPLESKVEIVAPLGGPVRDVAPESAQGNTAPGRDEGDYRVVEPEPSPSALLAPAPAPPAAPPEASTFEPATDDIDRVSTDAEPLDLPHVDAVWSRWAEWQQPLLWIGGSLAVALLIASFPVWTAALILLLGMAYGLYHIVITLEVPVRVTAEQAVKEFYAALSHRMPSYRRMWCLLTADAKHSDAFGDFARFRKYWHEQLAGLSSSPTWLKPLEFRVEGGKCRHNAEKTFATLRYKLRVVPRGSGDSAEPLAEFDVTSTTVKGRDGQWYLNDALLPEPAQPSTE